MFQALRDVLILLLASSSASNAQWLGDNPPTAIPGSESIPQTARDISTPTKAAETATATATVTTETPIIPGTCASRSINYLTHTLPQQCLRTDRVTRLSDYSGTLNQTVIANQTTHSDANHTPSLLVSKSEPEGTEAATSFADSEAELDSPLDNAHFLSFEEWKKQNLAKAGQSPENVGQGHTQSNGDRPRPGITNALEALGEENEIDLDFGFGRASTASDEAVYASATAAAAEGAPSTGPRVHRSKDAGKTCKERTNYASFDCAANVLKTNPECKSAASVLVEHKDSYMLNICSAENKFFIVELCDDIQVDTIVLANYEFFSSVFRQFRVSVSDRYPVKLDKWKDLGTFEARNTREMQAFLVENPLIWAKYLRIEILSHYGNEYYCPISLLRVHGTTMMQDYRHEEEMARGEVTEEVAEGEVTEAEKNANGEAKPVDVHHPVLDEQSATTEEIALPTEPIMLISNLTSQLMGMLELEEETPETTCALSDLTVQTPSTTVPYEQAAENKQEKATQETTLSKIDTMTSKSESRAISEDSRPYPLRITERPQSQTASVDTAISSQNSTVTDSGSKSPGDGANLTKTASQTAPQNPQPSTQESFFKSITKRLQQLESNSTLSLQYIEEQSRILRDAFTKVEKRQSTNSINFLSHLNDTVMTELQGFRQAYDQLWQSTVIELETHRELYQREMVLLSSRLSIVADELVWQKRMGIVQSTLLLLCLGLVLFSRQGSSYLEVPLMQQVVNRSQAALTRAGWDSEPGSPHPGKGSPVSIFRRRIWRSQTEPEPGNLTDGVDSRPETSEGPSVNVEPPTPPPRGASTSDEGENEELNGDSQGLKKPPAMHRTL